MAVKTITIDIDAYNTLTRFKKPGQSFSQVIKEQLGSVKNASTLIRTLKDITPSEETLDAVDRVVRDRRKNPLKHPKL